MENVPHMVDTECAMYKDACQSIPDKIRFPSKGDVYESKENQTIDFMTAWSKPFTGDGIAAPRDAEHEVVQIAEPDAATGSKRGA